MLQGEHSAILSTFIKLPFVITILVLSIFEWALKTGFTVFHLPLNIKGLLNTLSMTKSSATFLPKMFVKLPPIARSSDVGVRTVMVGFKIIFFFHV